MADAIEDKTDESKTHSRCCFLSVSGAGAAGTLLPRVTVIVRKQRRLIHSFVTLLGEIDLL
jgi:hypothetical protein